MPSIDSESNLRFVTWLVNVLIATIDTIQQNYDDVGLYVLQEADYVNNFPLIMRSPNTPGFTLDGRRFGTYFRVSNP